jgi:hypothetical protein
MESPRIYPNGGGGGSGVLCPERERDYLLLEKEAGRRERACVYGLAG